MAASAWIKFDKSIFYGMTGTIDYDDASAGIFKCALILDTWTPVTTADTWADISAHEHAAAYGYTAAGQALTSVTYTSTSGVDTWDSASPTWTATGGPITACYAVLYHVSSGKLIRYCELDGGSNKTAIDGNDFVVEMSASGIFDIS